jgi:hypothetical protein
LALAFLAASVAYAGSDAAAQSDAGAPAGIHTTGACPNAAGIEGVLSTIFPEGSRAIAAASITVSDLGDSYVVAVGPRTKTYSDPSRDCIERARIAAAFVALVLAPEATAPPTTTVAPPPPPTPPRRLPTPPAQRWLRVDARVAAEFAPQQGLVAPGAALTVGAGRGTFGVHATCAWSSSSSIGVAADAGSVAIERFPCAVGPVARIVPARGRLEVDVDPGLALGALIVRGRGFATTFEAARLEVGARLALDATLHLGSTPRGLAPVLGLEVTYYPAAYDLDVTSRGTVASSPNVWAGVTAGVCWTME